MHRMTRLGAAALALSAAVVGGTIAMAAPQRAVTIAGSDNTFDKTEINADPGETMDITFIGVGFTSAHSIVFDLGGGNIVGTEPASLGVTRNLSFTAPAEPGLYTYYCDVGNHRQLGMTGVLVVGSPGQAARAVPVEGSDYKYVPDEIVATPGEGLDVQFKNVQGFHDIVFDLDGGRQERTSKIQAGQEESLKFNAPTTPGTYDYYCSVGRHRENGMKGTLVVVGEGATPPPTAATPATVEPTPVPTDATSPVTPLIRDLKNPHGLWFQNVNFQGSEQDVLIVSEGGTGTAKPGEFTPGNGDGRVQVIGLDNPALQMTIVDNMTNAIDPGAGIVGANHALPWPLDSSASPTSINLLIAQSGGPGQLRPDEAAKILKVGLVFSTPTVLADTLAYETANNPDGADPDQGGIDSNPWRLVPGPAGDTIYIVDAGANDILKMDPTTGALSTWAVLEPYEDGAQQAIPTDLAFSPVDPYTAYVSLLGGFAAPTGRILRLTDVNKDGDILDEGEVHELVAGLDRPTALAFSPDGRLYVAELGARRIAFVPEVTAGGVPVQIEPVVTGVSSVTAMTFEPTGDLLVTYDIDGPLTGRASQNTDTIGRIAAGALDPSGAPTPGPTTYPTTSSTPTTPAPTATTPTGRATIYLPHGLRTAVIGG